MSKDSLKLAIWSEPSVQLLFEGFDHLAGYHGFPSVEDLLGD